MSTPEQITSREAAGKPSAQPDPQSSVSIAVVEQALQDCLRQLRERIGSRQAREDGEVEYDSWLRQLH